VLSEGILDHFDLWTLLRRFADYPEFAVVSEWLDCQELLSINHKFAKVVWAREAKPFLFPYDLSARNAGDNLWDSMAAKKEAAYTKAGKRALFVTHLG
jgi:hypothetical protein